MKKALKLVTAMVLFIVAGSFLMLGCSSPTDGAPGIGLPGAPGTIYLSGSETGASINAAIASGAPLVFAGVVQSDSDPVIIPAGRNIGLVGDPAYSVASTFSVVVVLDTGGINADSDGYIATGSGTSLTVVAPADVLSSKVVGLVSTKVPIQAFDDDFDDTASNLGIRGPLTLDADGIDALPTSTTKTYYVVGDLTVSAVIPATKLPLGVNVIGNLSTTTADQTQAIVWGVTGNLDAKKLPTTGAGTLMVGGNAEFAEAVTGITGTIDIAGNATFKGALTTAAAISVDGDLSVTGAVSLGANLSAGGRASLSSTLTNTAAAVLGAQGPITVTGVVTAGATGLSVGSPNSTVTLSALPALAGNLTLAGTVTVPSGAITIPASTMLSVMGKATFGGDTNYVTIANGSLISGSAGAASVAAGGVITLAGGATGASLILSSNGSITFAGDAELNVAAATPIVLSGGKFTNGDAALSLTAGATAAIATLTGSAALTKLTFGAGATLAIPAAATTGLILDGVIVDLSEAGEITIAENGVLNLGTTAAGAAHAGGIITRYDATGNVVVAGGAASGNIATATNVTAFNDQDDYDAIEGVISTGVSIQGVITAGGSANNSIDKNDTFAGGTSPAINVTNVANG